MPRAITAAITPTRPIMIPPPTRREREPQAAELSPKLPEAVPHLRPELTDTGVDPGRKVEPVVGPRGALHAQESTDGLITEDTRKVSG